MSANKTEEKSVAKANTVENNVAPVFHETPKPQKPKSAEKENEIQSDTSTKPQLETKPATNDVEVNKTETKSEAVVTQSKPEPNKPVQSKPETSKPEPGKESAVAVASSHEKKADLQQVFTKADD